MDQKCIYIMLVVLILQQMLHFCFADRMNANFGESVLGRETAIILIQFTKQFQEFIFI